MKNINQKLTLTALIILTQACGLRPDLAEAPKSLNAENLATAAAFAAPTGTVSEEVRAATLLVYPDPQDVDNLEFSPLQSAPSDRLNWNTVLEALPYSSSILTKFTLEQDPFFKAKEIAKLILATGQVRDVSFRERDVLAKKEKEASTVLSQRESENNITSASFTPYSCFYNRSEYNPAEDIYRCKLVKEGDYKIKKAARNCLQFSRFTFVDQLDANGTTLHELCRGLVSDVVALQTQIENKRRIRVSGENVVIDLLVNTERANERIFIMTPSTLEKPDTSGGPTSTVKFNREYTEVESMKLYVDFLSPYTTAQGRQEYSYCTDGSCNGKISKPVITFKTLRDRTYPQVAFTLTLPDMEIDVKADLSYEPGVMGLRLVDSKTYVRYNDGTKRRGVFKLEFEVL